MISIYFNRNHLSEYKIAVTLKLNNMFKETKFFTVSI